MKHLKKKGFWIFYIAVVLAGAFIIVGHSGLKNQSHVIPNVSAQEFGGISSSSIMFNPIVDMTSQSCGIWIMHASPGLPIEVSDTPAY